MNTEVLLFNDYPVLQSLKVNRVKMQCFPAKRKTEEEEEDSTPKKPSLLKGPLLQVKVGNVVLGCLVAILLIHDEPELLLSHGNEFLHSLVRLGAALNSALVPSYWTLP